MCAVLHGEGGVIWNFQNGERKLFMKSSISFCTITLSFLEKNYFFLRNSCFPVRSVFVINVSLLTSGVCYCQNGIRRNHGKCSLCNEWWHSFMNHRLNHLVLLYTKSNCIRIMSLNTHNKNVDIISQNQATRSLKTISSHKYEERRIEVYDK